MHNFLKKFKEWIIVWLWILFVFSTVYAIDYTATTGEILSAQKWNDLVSKTSWIFTDENDNVWIWTINPTVKLEVNWFTKLWINSPGIKIKKITWIAASSEWWGANLAHWLNWGKVISHSCIIQHGIGGSVPPWYIWTTWYQFSYVLSNDWINFKIFNHPTNSESILSDPIVCLAWYED